MENLTQRIINVLVNGIKNAAELYLKEHSTNETVQESVKKTPTVVEQPINVQSEVKIEEQPKPQTKRGRKKQFTAEQLKERAQNALEEKRFEIRQDETSDFLTAKQYGDWIAAHPSEIYQLWKWCKKTDSFKQGFCAMFHLNPEKDEGLIVSMRRYLLHNPKMFGLFEKDAANGVIKWDTLLVRNYFAHGRCPKNM